MTPVGRPGRGLGQLALELRVGRHRRGLSRQQLAEKIGRSVATIQRAEAGRVRPSWPVTRDITDACGMDREKIERCWKQASRPNHATGLTNAPLVSLVRTPADLAAALRRAWQVNGAPSLRRMEARAEARSREFAPLSRMSAWRIRERKQQPSTTRQLLAYLTACDIPEESFRPWVEAWHRARRHETATHHSTPPAQTHGSDVITPTKAVELMHQAGLHPLDPYPGMHGSWAAECVTCRRLSRFRLAAVTAGAACPVCRSAAGA